MPFRPFRSSSTTTTSSPHESYSITCDCGKVVEGERTAQSQRIRCPVCEATYYVLPRDVYPTPQIVETPPPEPIAKTITFAAADEPATKQESIEEDWLDPEPEPESEYKRLAEPVDPTPKRVWLERPSGKTIRKQLFRVAVAAGVLVLVTAWWISRRNAIREAEQSLQLHREQAISFADEGLWEEALAEAELGVEAARVLGREDSVSSELFTLWRELDILQNLSILSPIEIVMQKEDAEKSRDDWIREFRVKYAESWLILDATIRTEEREDPDSGDDPKKTITSYHFEFPIGLESEDVRFVWSKTPEWFARLSYPNGSARVLVAAKLEDVRFLDQDSDAWEMILTAEDSHLWTNSQMLDRALGISSISDTNRELNALIESQKKIVLQAKVEE